jgi:hypothetical protein
MKVKKALPELANNKKLKDYKTMHSMPHHSGRETEHRRADGHCRPNTFSQDNKFVSVM